MNIRDLKYLVAVAETGHFGKASEKSCVSQPTLSMQLKKLEEILGVKIFERNNKQVFITEVGEEILHHAKMILNHEKLIKEVAQDYQDPLGGKAKIGGFPTFAPYYFPSFMNVLTNILPDLTVFLVEEKTEILLDKLKNGEIDAAFIAYPMTDPQLEYERVYEESFYLASHKSHPISQKPIILSSDLKDQPLLLLEEGHCMREQALDVCQLSGAYEFQEFRATSLETLRAMVSANMGMTLMPDIARKKGENNIVYTEIRDDIVREIGLVWRKTSTKQKLIDKLLKVSEEALNDRDFKLKHS